MGLSSSQARLLTLTARMHQIEYSAARVEAMKLQMANESRRVYEEYLDALDQAKVQIKTLTTNGAVTFVDLTNYTDFIASGFALNWHGSTFDGESMTVYKDGDGKYYGVNDVPRDDTGEPTGVTEVAATWDLLKEILGIPDETNFEETLTNLINCGDVTIVAKDTKNNKFLNEGEEGFVDFETSIAINTKLQEVTDEVKLRKAEAKYEADMKRIDMKDRRYDTELAALDNERNAIKQEMETLKTVAKDNVERTFKIFS